ncbi:MAG: hypothetical protein ACOCU3_01730 [bacterium]
MRIFGGLFSFHILESLQHNAITINYPHDGEFFRPGEVINSNLSHLYSEDSDAVVIELLTNNEKIAEVNNNIRLRMPWHSYEPCIFIFQLVVRDESGQELYRSAEVEIIIQD